MSNQLSPAQLIAYKQELQAKYPGSVGKIATPGGKIQEAIFLQRAYDDDVIIYDSGTAIYRTSFLDSPSPTKYANMKVAVETARAKGYEPTGAFTSGWFNERKLRIAEAKKQYQQETSVFPEVEIKRLSEIRKEREEFGTPVPMQPQFQQPQYDRISQQPQLVPRPQPMTRQYDPNAAATQLLKELGGFKPYQMRNVPKKEPLLGGFASEIKGTDASVRGAGWALLSERGASKMQTPAQYKKMYQLQNKRGKK